MIPKTKAMQTQDSLRPIALQTTRQKWLTNILLIQLERNSTIAGPGESDAWEHLGAKVIVLACSTFSVTKTCKLAQTIIVNVFCHFSRSF